MMWLSAARHADVLSQTTSIDHHRSNFLVLRIQLTVWKSDRMGARRFTKFLQVSGALARFVQMPTIAPARELDKTLKGFLNGAYTKHSIRKGAINVLAEQFTPEEIIQLTGHTPVVDTARRLNAYIQPQAHHPQGLLQRRMSSFLEQQLLSSCRRAVSLPQ
jgi:hypothetical protein